MQLNLKRPIAFFDIESTGLNVSKDRIVELSILRIETNNNRISKTWVVNPDYPISEEAASVHGFTNESVKDKPTFKQYAKEISKFLANCDLAGYNSNKFDIPMLVEEFLRVDVDFEINNRKLIDVQTIFMKMEQRTLKAAVKFFLNKDLENAHSAEADVLGTFEVLEAQLDKYADVEFTDKEGSVSKPVVNDMEALAKFSTHHRNADLMGQIIFNKDGVETFNFGKNRGRTVAEVFLNEPSYYNWMMNADFPLYTKKILTRIKLGM